MFMTLLPHYFKSPLAIYIIENRKSKFFELYALVMCLMIVYSVYNVIQLCKLFTYKTLELIFTLHVITVQKIKFSLDDVTGKFK